MVRLRKFGASKKTGRKSQKPHPLVQTSDPAQDLSERLVHEDQMYEFLLHYSQKNELPELAAALPFARDKHKGQVRRGKAHVPFLYHPLMVACHAVALGIGEDDVLATAVLHDVCEDCGVSPEELPAGETVQKAVYCLTRKEISGGRTAEGEREYYRQIAENRIASLVKLLDRCNNISSMANGFSEEGIRYYIKDTETWVYPLFEKTSRSFPEYDNQLFAIKYHMSSVIDSLKYEL